MPLPTTANVTRPRSHGYGARLDDLYLRLVPSPQFPLRTEPAPASAQRVSTAQLPEEFVTDFGDVFARSDFTGGEGLDRAHRRDAAGAASRYYDARGVRVHPPQGGSPQRVTLIERTERIDAIAEDRVQLAYDGTRLLATGGDGVRVTADPLGASPTFATEDPHDGETATAVLRLAGTPSGVTYAALGAGGIHERDAAGAWTHYSDLQADGVWWAQNRLMASKDNAVYEVTASGAAPPAITTLPAGAVVNDVADADAAILVAASDGRVYALRPDSGGTLELVAQTRFPSEEPTCVGAVQGVVVVGTAQGAVRRLWRARLTAGGILDDRQVLREWRSHHGLAEIATSRDSTYVIVHEMGDDEGAFAWQFDAAHAAVHRAWRFPGTDPHGTGVVVIGETLLAGLADATAGGVHRTTDLYEESGWLTGPLGDFYSGERKPWVRALMEAGVGVGQEVCLNFTTHPEALGMPASTMWVRAITATSASERLEAPLVGVEARALAGQVCLFAGMAGASTPAVYSFAFRAYPRADEQIIRLPVDVSDRVAARGRHHTRAPRLGGRTWEALRQRQGDAVLLHVLRPEIVLRGIVEGVETPIVTLPRRGSPTWVSVVTVRGRPASLSSALSLAGATGTAMTGMPPPTGGVA